MQILKTKAARIAASIASATALVISGAGISAALASGPTAAPASNIYGCVTGSTRTLEHVFTIEKNFDKFLTNHNGKCPNGFPFTVETNQTEAPPSPTPTATSSSPTPTPTATTPTPIPTTTSATCVINLGDNCGAYDDRAHIPMSNGYDTYVSNQDVGANSSTTETVRANSPQDWSVTANAQPYGYEGVQTFPDVQQLTNDWDGHGWDGNSDTPVDSLSSLKVNYSESGPTDAQSIYEFAPDVWTNYSSDVMFWVDTHGRCNPGAYGGTILGTATFDGQTWTVNRYGNAGAEIIFVLDSDPNKPNSCAQQKSGTVDIKAGLDWLVAHGYIKTPLTMSQLNTGWEITSADNTVFTMKDYSITATT